MPVVRPSTGSISILFVVVSLLTFTSVRVPIPALTLGFTVRDILSSSFRLWIFDANETVVLTFETFTFSWTKLLSKKYRSLSIFPSPPTVPLKNTSSNWLPLWSVPIPVLIPITFEFFLTAKTSEGRVKVPPVGDVEIAMFDEVAVGKLTINFWFVLNGWFSK